MRPQRREIDMQKPLQELRTPDLYLSAFFLSSGIELLRTDREGARMFFVFKTDSDVEQLRRAWTNDTALIRAQSFTHAIKNLKAMCFER
jgi:hypothetical protein